MSASSRQGVFFLFISVVMFVGGLFDFFSLFECLLLVCLGGVVLKLTDIEEVLGEK